MKSVITALTFMILTVVSASAYVFGPEYADYSVYPAEQHIVDYYPVDRFFTHVRHHPMRTVHHHYPVIRDFHQTRHTFSYENVDVFHSPLYGGSYGYGYTPYFSYPYGRFG